MTLVNGDSGTANEDASHWLYVYHHDTYGYMSHTFQINISRTTQAPCNVITDNTSDRKSADIIRNSCSRTGHRSCRQRVASAGTAV